MCCYVECRSAECRGTTGVVNKAQVLQAMAQDTHVKVSIGYTPGSFIVFLPEQVGDSLERLL